MKIVVAGRREMLRLPIAALAVLVIAASVITLFVTLGSGTDARVVSRTADFNSAAVLGALDGLGARDVRQAVELWSEGVAAKNCASQYAVMSDALRERYLGVIGDELMLAQTSAAVDSWYIDDISEDDGVTTAKLLFTISQGDGSTVTASAELTLEEEGDYVVVSSVAVEKPLYEFTGIRA